MTRQNLARLLILSLAVSCLVAGSAHGTRHLVTMQNFSFTPSTLTVAPNDTIVWKNIATVTQHTSTSGSGCIADGIWNSGLVAPGDSFRLTLATPGSYPYFCIPHCDFMTGTITVSGTGAEGRPPAPGTAPAQLGANRPNPFGPYTVIDYQVARAGNVRVRIFNSAGQRVRTLVEGYRPAGTYSILWDGRNDKGEKVSSGIFFYQLKVGGALLERKMIKLD